MYSQDFKNVNQFILWLKHNSSITEDISFGKLKFEFNNRYIKTFNTIKEIMEFIKNIFFKDTYIIITNTIFGDFISQFEKEMNDIYIIPKFIIYSKNKPNIHINNNNFNNKYLDYYLLGNIQTSFYGIINFIKNLEEKIVNNMGYLNNYASNKTKEKMIDKFGFEYIDKADKLILPVYFRNMVKIDSPNKVYKFNYYLYNKYRNDFHIENLLSQIINIKNIPIQLLCKYWARAYTADSFCYEMNKDLRNDEYNKYKIFIQVMYEGLNLKSLKAPMNNTVFYRGTQLSIPEINEFEKSLNKSSINNLPSSIVYTKAFLSFSKDIEIAKKFASKDDLGFNMKRVLLILENENSSNYNTNVDIEKIAIIPKEKEILFFPFSCFEIINIKSKVFKNEEFKIIKINYVSHYDSKLKNIFIKNDSQKLISSSLISSQFKDDISSIIEKDEIDKASISDIIQKSKGNNNEEKQLGKKIQNKKINFNKISYKINKSLTSSKESLFESENNKENYNNISNNMKKKTKKKIKKMTYNTNQIDTKKINNIINNYNINIGGYNNINKSVKNSNNSIKHSNNSEITSYESNKSQDNDKEINKNSSHNISTHTFIDTSNLSQCFLKNKVYIFITIGIIIVIILAISLSVGLRKRGKKEGNIFNEQEEVQEFQEVFQIITKEDTLTQFYFESYQSYETIINGEISPYIIYSKAIYEIYTLNSSSVSEEDKKYYNKKYLSTIALNSFCDKLILKNDQSKCELKSMLNLNKKENRNLRRNELNYYSIKNAILPICIIEHTNTNLIISITCPITISEILKKNIIQAFQSTNPTILYDEYEINNNTDIYNINISKKDNIYINILNNECPEFNKKNDKIKKCKSETNIIADKNRMVLSSFKEIINNNFEDAQNYYIENLTYYYKNITKENQNSTKYNPNIYKSNLNLLLNSTSPLMKKDIIINNFNHYFRNLDQIIEKNAIIKNNSTNSESIMVAKKTGIYSENIFYKNIFNIPLELNLVNEIGLEKGEYSKTYFIYKINDDYNYNISFEENNFNLRNILIDFISLTKSGNKLAYNLNQQLNKPLLNLMDLVRQNIKQIINYCFPNEEDLKEIFDSSLFIRQIDSLPFDFISIIQNLIISMYNFNDDIPEILNNTIINLNIAISSFLLDSHNLLDIISNDINEITNILNSTQSKIYEISSYYLKEENTSYHKSIESYNEIIYNYYKIEIDKLLPLINNILFIFNENVMFYIKRFNSKLDDIIERLKNKNLVITSANSEDYNNVITDIENSKVKIDEILLKINKTLLEGILQENGFFESQKEINERNKNYESITSKAFSISYILDNNDLIDISFDNTMINFKNNFLFLLKYMSDILKENFPLKENVLNVSYFDNNYMQQFDNSLKNEKEKILNYINKENEEYLKSVNKIIDEFIKKNGTLFKQSIFKLSNNFNELFLNNLNKVFGDYLYYVLNNIKEIIENNTILANEYLNNVNNANSEHCTQGFKDKYNIYITNNQDLFNLTNNLKENLENAYFIYIKNKINQLLQNMTYYNNIILQKYNKNLISFAEYQNNSLQVLIDRVNNKHITKEIFTQRYLASINDLITEANNTLINNEKNFENIYNNIIKKSYSEKIHDYDVLYVSGGDRYCCDYFLGMCMDHCRTPVVYSYEGKNVIGTNNHLNIQFTPFSDYLNILDNRLNDLYANLSSDITLYQSYLTELENKIINLKNQILKVNDSIYLSDIELYITSVINEKLENNLLKATFDFYENKIINDLPISLDNILNKWENTYDNIYRNITNHKLHFKYPINELFITASSYIEIYNKNISNDYINSVIDKLKNDVNYTIKYYYNIINLKVNYLCSDILNDLPKNEKAFDEIIHTRYIEIKNVFNNILNQINNSKINYLNKNLQEKELNITSNNYFNINNIINEHINSFNIQLNKTLNNIKIISDEINNIFNETNELIVSKLYLENNINKGQINFILDEINDINFIDLENDNYQNIINDIFKNDNDMLFNNIKNSFDELNNYNLIKFNQELEQYRKILRDKLNNEFYTKKNLEEKINIIFSNGLLNNIDKETKQKIYDIIDSILNKIKDHISTEGKRLSNEKASYSNNLDNIKKRLNDYKNNIYEKIHSALISEVEDFKSKINEKFYRNHILSDLVKFSNYFNKSNFGTAPFLNMSINLDEIILKEISLIIDEYKNITIDRIEYLYLENVHSLDEIFSFSNIELKINNEIDTAFYSSDLFYILTGENNNQKEESFYDFSSSIINDIDTSITEGIKKIKEIMKKIEGSEYEIKDKSHIDFKNINEDIINKIKNKFEYFTINQINEENQQFDNNLNKIISDNFKSILNNIIPFFSFDYYERILNLNKNQKIKVLNNNIKYSLYQTMTYYINISKSNEDLNLPENIKDGILTFNNIESILDLQINNTIYTLNKQIKQITKKNNNYITIKYKNNIISDPSFISLFNNNIYVLINNKLNNYINTIEDICDEQMKRHVIDSFILNYINILNKENEDINYIIQSYKNELLKYLKDSFSFEINSFLTTINYKFNETNSSIENYLSYFNTFKISDEIKDFFEEKIIEEKIIIIYEEFNSLIMESTAKYVINNLEFNSNKYKTIYSIEIFKEKINKTNLNFNSKIALYSKILYNYGFTQEIYEQNLENEIYNYKNEINHIEQLSYNISYEISFNELKNASFILEHFIQNRSLFSELENKINNLNYNKDMVYKYLKYIISLYKSDINNYFVMLDELNALNDITLEYYSKVCFVYSKMKDQIIDNIMDIIPLILNCENTTNEVINSNYIKSLNNFSHIVEYHSLMNTNKNIPNYSYYDSDNIFKIETKNLNDNNYYVFRFDVIDDDNTLIPKIKGNLINNVPISLIIDFYTSEGPLGKIGKKINIDFNKIYIETTFIFDTKLNKVSINTNLKVDESSVRTQYYEERISFYQQLISGIYFLFPNNKETFNIETPDNEKYYKISSKKETIIETYQY